MTLAAELSPLLHACTTWQHVSTCRVDGSRRSTGPWQVATNFRANSSHTATFANALDVGHVDSIEVVAAPQASDSPADGDWNLFSVSVLKTGDGRLGTDRGSPEDVTRDRYATFYHRRCCSLLRRAIGVDCTVTQHIVGVLPMKSPTTAHKHM